MYKWRPEASATSVGGLKLLVQQQMQKEQHVLTKPLPSKLNLCLLN
jgi:hypothetical protein